MADTTIEVAALNIVASPHPDGIYLKLFQHVAGKEILLWGSDRAKITEPRAIEGRDNYFYGEVLVWAHIDTDSPWLNTDTDTEATDEEMQAVVEALPTNLEPNFRPFTYVLNQAEHIVLLEIRNEAGQRFSPKRAKRMFARLFEDLPADLPEVDVTVIPEEETLEKIFAIKRLRKLDIVIKRPNGDDLGDDFKRVMDALTQEGVRVQKIEKTKAAKVPTITPNEDTKKLAVIASTNGYVSGEGKDELGNPVFESTEEHPKIRKLDVNTSTFATVVAAFRFFIKQAMEKPIRGD
ncbi:MAG: DUF4747 family protein [Pseudomonadota bacterium]